VITRNGKPVGVLLGAEDEDDLERLLMAYSPKLQKILAAARQRIREGAGIPHEQFWAEVQQEGDRKRPKANGRR
jgi:PHD/YefM family antitoxin component YafN of YafNO toxin-antitoxin module